MSKKNKSEREKAISKTSVIGIITNIFLSAFKAVVGLISGSISIILDAVNNISDALSSVITIIGIKLAHKSPDKKHPLGYGRIEYLTSLIISAIIISVGVTSLKESIEKIIHPSENLNYTIPLYIIMVVAIVTKLVLGRYTISKGKKYNSESLIASGKDAMFDSVVTLSTIISALVYVLSNNKLNVDGYLGVVISIIIIKSGLEMISEVVSELLGKRVDSSIVKSIKKEILEFDLVRGVFDLYLDNYGPDNYIGFVHIEIDDNLSASEINKLTRAIQAKIYMKFGIGLTIGIYAINTKDSEIVAMIKRIKEILGVHKEILQVHGIYIDKEKRTISFDIVVDFSVTDRLSYYNMIKEEIEKEYLNYICDIQIDTDVSLTE